MTALEYAAWKYLTRTFLRSETSDQAAPVVGLLITQHPADLTYSCDDMARAFVAGAEFARVEDL